jgi:hypothetical protein
VLARPKFLNPFGCTSATGCLWRFLPIETEGGGQTPQQAHAPERTGNQVIRHDRFSSAMRTISPSTPLSIGGRPGLYVRPIHRIYEQRALGPMPRQRSRIKRSAMFCAVRRSILPPKTTDDAGQGHEDGGERRIEHKMLFQSNLKRRQLHLKPKILSYTGSARMTQVREMQCRRP